MVQGYEPYFSDQLVFVFPNVCISSYTHTWKFFSPRNLGLRSTSFPSPLPPCMASWPFST